MVGSLCDYILPRTLRLQTDHLKKARIRIRPDQLFSRMHMDLHILLGASSQFKCNSEINPELGSFRVHFDSESILIRLPQ